MVEIINNLPADIQDRLKKGMAEKDGQIQSLQQKVTLLEEQLNWLKRQVFGTKSERVVTDLDIRQLLLDGMNLPEAKAAPETATPIAAHTRKQRVKKGEGDCGIDYPDNLRVEQVKHDLPEEEKICPVTGGPMQFIGWEVSSRKLAIKPEELYLREHLLAKYVSPASALVGVKTASMPALPIEKCAADVSLLAHIAVNKYADHLPLYRSAERFERQGVFISRQTFSNWVIGTGLALGLLYEAMKSRVLAGNAIFADETLMRLQAKGKCLQVYMWVYVGGASDGDPPYRFYEFCLNRKYENAERVLKNFHGHLHSDQYGAYVNLATNRKIVWCPCMAHIRRKFFEAECPEPKLRNFLLRKIRHLFFYERIAWNSSPEERLRIRREKEKPILAKITAVVKARLIRGGLLPKSKFRTALEYYLTAEPYLENYLSNPAARLENNVAERAERPVVINRKNSLFVGSEESGKATATLFSLIQTCRALGINPEAYLEDVLSRIMSHPSERIHELLPDEWARAKGIPLRRQAPYDCHGELAAYD